MANRLFTIFRSYCTRKIFLISAVALGLVVTALVIICVVVLRPSDKTTGSQVNPTTSTSASTTSSTEMTTTFLTTISTSTTSSSTVTSSSSSTISSTASTVTTTTSTVPPTATTPDPEGVCEIDLTDSAKLRRPLLMNIDKNALVYPEVGTTAKLYTPQSLELSCSDENPIIISGRAHVTPVKVTCISDDIFLINGTKFKWSSTVCQYDIKPKVNELEIRNVSDDNPNRNCSDVEKSLKLITIGFPFNSTFLNIIYICFDVNSEIALYSNYVLSSSIANAATPTKPDFKQDNEFYIGKSVSSTYDDSKATINEILGLNETSDTYINELYYIDKGHLAANTDFYYAALQTAANRFINTAPQWNTFGDGNWNKVEERVKNYASANLVDLQIWTGTYGNAALNSTKSQPTEIYLYGNEDRRELPVPEVFWRIVYNSVNESGIILVGHNNPYEANIVQKICDKDVSDSVSWLDWNRTDIRQGYAYACDCNDDKFHSLVPKAPYLSAKYLLT